MCLDELICIDFLNDHNSVLTGNVGVDAYFFMFVFQV